jgi:hypothetical protein
MVYQRFLAFMNFFKFFEFRTNFEKKTGGLLKPHPGGFGKPTGLPPVLSTMIFTGLQFCWHLHGASVL